METRQHSQALFNLYAGKILCTFAGFIEIITYRTWRIHGIRRAQVMKRVAPVEIGAPELWPFVLQLIEDCVAAGYLKQTPAFKIQG